MEKKSVVKACFIKAGHLKHSFSESKCIIPISIGQSYHEGEKLRATIDLVNKNFRSCVIVICDSLQRHTIALFKNCVMDEAYAEAVEAGSQWLIRNQSIIDRLTIPVKIFRWDSWLHHPNYRSYRETVDELYRSDLSTQLAYLSVVESFLDRYKDYLGIFYDVKKTFSLCLEYVKEECSVMPLWAEEKINFELYPSKRSKAMVVTHAVLVEPYFDKLLQYVQVNFNTRMTKEALPMVEYQHKRFSMLEDAVFGKETLGA